MPIDWKNVAAKRLRTIKALNRVLDARNKSWENHVTANLLAECKAREWGRLNIVDSISRRAASLAIESIRKSIDCNSQKVD